MSDLDLQTVDAGPAVDAIDYTSFGSAIDLFAVKKRDIQGIRIVTVATTPTITVTVAGEGSSARTLSVASGEFLPLRVRTIESVSDVTRVRVYWGRY